MCFFFWDGRASEISRIIGISWLTRDEKEKDFVRFGLLLSRLVRVMERDRHDTRDLFISLRYGLRAKLHAGKINFNLR